MVGFGTDDDNSVESPTQEEVDAEFESKKKVGGRRSSKSAAPVEADERKVATILIACGAFEMDGAMWGAKTS